VEVIKFILLLIPRLCIIPSWLIACAFCPSCILIPIKHPGWFRDMWDDPL